MSQNLLTTESGVGLTRFYGGENRGMCYQITMPNSVYIQLTSDECLLICGAIFEEIMLRAGYELHKRGS